jgi:hypothetical protein
MFDYEPVDHESSESILEDTLLDILVERGLTPQERLDKLEKYRGISESGDDYIDKMQDTLREEIDPKNRCPYCHQGLNPWGYCWNGCWR